MPDETGEITLLLQKWRDGDRQVENELFSRVFPSLRRLAHYLMKGERRGHSLQPTELVNQVYLRLVAAKDRDWQNRRHFFAISARAMRRYLIDYARARPSAEVMRLEGIGDLLPADSAKLDQAIAVSRLLDQLLNVKPEWCELVELKYFLGLTDEETAETLGIKLRTMQRMWSDARQWLFENADSRSAEQSAGR